MKIYPVKPHKRTILDFNESTFYVPVPESSFVIKNKEIYYGIIKHDCLISTNLGLALNCGDWKHNIKNDKELINRFWNSKFVLLYITEIEMDIGYGFIPLKQSYDKEAMQKLINEYLRENECPIVKIESLEYQI